MNIDKQDEFFDKLTITDDFIFGVVMRQPDMCRPLLERILGIKISRIEYPDSQKTIDISRDSKSVRLDIYVEDEAGTVYNAEMQAHNRGDLPRRSRYYQAMIDLNLIEKGMDYGSIRESFIIFICTFDPFGEGRHIYTFESRCRENLQLLLEDGCTRVFINTKGTADDVSDELKVLLEYIEHGTVADEYTAALDDSVKETRSNEKWRREYMTLYMREQEKFQEGHNSGFAEGEKQGFQEGEKSGFQKGEKQGFQKGEKQGFQKGEKQGFQKGEQQGEKCMAALIKFLSNDGRMDDIVRISTDIEYREKLYREYGLK